jgi:ribosome-binding protein aMBF1 (putative translation factor)
MEPCEWCEEEITSSSIKTKVVGKEFVLCEDCRSAYVHGGVKELNRRRNWDSV